MTTPRQQEQETTRVRLEDISTPIESLKLETTPHWDRLEGRTLIRLYRAYSREVHNTEWMSVGDFKEDFKDWLWDYLGGELTDDMIDDVPILVGAFSEMKYVNDELASKLLEAGSIAGRRRRRTRRTVQSAPRSDSASSASRTSR